MNKQTFIITTQEKWSKYLTSIYDEFLSGKLTLIDCVKPLFPNMLLITETEDYFIAELFGISDEFKGLSVKGHNEKSYERYFSQFNSDVSAPLMEFAGDNIYIRGGHFSRTPDFEKFSSRFPILKSFPNGCSLLPHPENGGSLFKFTEKTNFLRFSNVFLINTYQNVVRAKHILYATVIRKDVKIYEYVEWLHNIFAEKMVEGIFSTNSNFSEEEMTASQFSNAFLMKNLRETTIGEFLKLHPQIITKSIGAKGFVYEPTLIWMEGTEDRKPMNPDLLVERADGFYDIYDLKTALLDKKNITKGKRNRRSFISYVDDGISQIANYARYFNYQKNCEYAFNKYGIKINEPNLVLIVGHYGNADKTEISEAFVSRANNISIIDYDSLLQLFLASKGIESK